MISTVSRFTTSLMNHIGESTSDLEVEIRVEEIRKAMLGIMSEIPDEQASRPAIWSKVFSVNDIQTLWYLRVDLMALLAEHVGEIAAREKLATVTEIFRGVVPRSQFARKPRLCC
jgi:hypothetical protein